MASNTTFSVMPADPDMDVSASPTGSQALTMPKPGFTNSTQPYSTRTVTVSDGPETETRITTILSTSFTTHTITTTVPGIPGVVYTTKTSTFPNISDASVSEEWMTATGARLSQLLSLTDSNGRVPKPLETYSMATSSEHLTESDLETIMTTPSSLSSSGVSEGFASTPARSLPATVSAVTTSSDGAISTSSLSFPSSSPPSISSTRTLLSPASMTFSPLTSTATNSDDISAVISNSVVPFTSIDPARSSDYPSTVDCATWSPYPNNEPPPRSVSDPFDFNIINTESISTRASRYSVHRRDTSWSALDARGYGLLVAWFVVGAIAGIALVLIALRLWTWRTRRKLATRTIPRPVRRYDNAWIDRRVRRRHGSTSPTHVSGMESLSQDRLMHTRLLRRSWQEDSVV